MKPLPKLLLIMVIMASLFFTYRHFVQNGTIKQGIIEKSIVPIKTDAISASVLNSSANVKLVSLPTNTPVNPCMDGNTKNCINGPIHEFEEMAWNAQMGFNFSVGGAHATEGKDVYIQTSKGSLMEKYGVNIKVRRMDDTGQMRNDLIATQSRLQTNPNAPGIKGVIIMFDGGAQFAADLLKACPQCRIVSPGPVGYSSGEDGFWGPPEWADSTTGCEAMRGGLTIGVLRDGDWNIAIQKIAQCGIPNNPDEKTYDPKAMNWVNADTYLKAVESIVNPKGYCEDRDIKGSRFGSSKKHICAQGVVTWTPGDVNLALQKGGFVPIMTTRNNLFQMPAAVIVLKSWADAHQADVDHIMQAAWAAADQIRANPDALRKAGEISQIVYHEETPDYWVKYYNGVTQADAKGKQVQLGGSRVANLADALQAFGLLNPGDKNLLAATYNTFGDYVVANYPKYYPSYPPADSILDSFITRVKASNDAPTGGLDAVNNVAADPNAHITKIAGREDFNIQFASGTASILPESYIVLNRLSDKLALSNYIVALHGHTDAARWTGLSESDSAQKNMDLSTMRAKSVETYLRSKGVKNTINSIGHGQDEPLPGTNATSADPRNRRVQVVVGQ